MSTILTFVLFPTNMASLGPAYDEDEFISSLLGVSTESPMQVDSNILANEIRNLECMLKNNGADKPSQICETGTSEQNTARKYTCEICKRSFCNRFNLKRHLKASRCGNAETQKCVDIRKPSKCGFCGKLFSNSWNLKKH